MSQFELQLDDDLAPIFNRLTESGFQATPDTILLLQILRRLDSAGPTTPGTDDGIEVVARSRPVPPPDPTRTRTEQLLDSLTEPGKVLQQDFANRNLDAEATTRPEPQQPTQQQPSEPTAPPVNAPAGPAAASQQAPQPAPEPAPQPASQPVAPPPPRPVAQPIAQPVSRPVNR
jgi:hypothetical protein